jgi:hypothetical protein
MKLHVGTRLPGAGLPCSVLGGAGLPCSVLGLYGIGYVD